MTAGAHNPKGPNGLDNPANTGGARLNRTGSPAGSTVIYGTQAEIMAYVGSDVTKANTAKTQELAAVAPRAALLAALQAVIDA